jgi:hypothetical protein
MTPQKAFGYFYGIHLHFMSEEYNILKYGPNTKQSQSRFAAMSTDQRYKFQWVSNKWTETQDLVYACIAAEFAELDIRYADKVEITDSFFEFKSRRESMRHVLKSNYTKYEIDGEQPLQKLIFSYFAGDYCPEFILLLDKFEDKLDGMYESKTLSFAKPKLLKLKKYREFFNSTKYLDIIANQNENTISA